MIAISEVEHIHNLLISEFGGSQGVRDRSGLESALARPFQTFDGLDLLPSVLEKAASLIESLLINHPFIDGNKRTGYMVLRLFLIKNGLDITASSDDKYAFVIDIASGKIKFEEIVHWLEVYTEKISSG